MKRLSKAVTLGAIAGSLILGTASAMAQGQGRGNLDPAQFQEQMMEGYQERLGMSADEFKAVRPLIEGVMAKNRELQATRSTGGVRGRGRGQGQGQGGDDQGQGRGRGRGVGGGAFGATPAPEVEALQKAIESGSAADIKAKLEALRAVRKKKEAELQEAREKLRKVLTAKQEAQLVLGTGGFGGALLD